MSTLKTAALAAAVLGGSLASAEAQFYGHSGHYGQGYGYGHHYRQPAPQYVHPRILRKQLQMQKRVIQKYGHVQPYGYHQPHPHWGYHHPRPRPHISYHYGW
jgi:hypothetical protein